jgi:hypothetical protein
VGKPFCISLQSTEHATTLHESTLDRQNNAIRVARWTYIHLCIMSAIYPFAHLTQSPVNSFRQIVYVCFQGILICFAFLAAACAPDNGEFICRPMENRATHSSLIRPNQTKSQTRAAAGEPKNLKHVQQKIDADEQVKVLDQRSKSVRNLSKRPDILLQPFKGPATRVRFCVRIALRFRSLFAYKEFRHSIILQTPITTPC